jgi:hypothetical protein
VHTERERTIYSRRIQNTTGEKKKKRYSRTIEEKLLSFQNNGYLHNAKHQDLQQTEAALQLTKMMKENAATQELDSNAQERRQTTMLASPPLSGFAAFQSEAVKVRKTDRRRRREAVRELGGGWRARALCAPWRTRFSRPVRFPCSQICVPS